MLYLLTWCIIIALGGRSDPQPSQELLYYRLGERRFVLSLWLGKAITTPQFVALVLFSSHHAHVVS